MISRKIESKIEDFYKQNKKKALLITGARQTGKTYSIRQYGKTHFDNFIEINFLENPMAASLFENASNSKTLILQLSALTDKPLITGKTLIFFDEVQACKEIITAIKFLVDEGSYSYILSGSLLGIEMKDIRSIPVGYMDIYQMYPLDLEEFFTAVGISNNIIESLHSSFESKTEVNTLIHQKMMEVFRLYLIVGGMPAVVDKYLKTNNIQEVINEQKAIIELYKKDISQYDKNNKLYLEEIFDLIPSELNCKNKRFILKNLNENFKLSRYENSFIWLKDAGVALPTYNVTEPTYPLKLSKSSNLFKLFLSDVGLLASMYMNNIQVQILNKEKSINFGSVYENVAAQQFNALGFDLYYYNNKKNGEIDFLLERNGEILPIEIKSGKDYNKHSALNNLLSNPDYSIKEAYVFQNENVNTKGKITYYPIYMLMFIENKILLPNPIYKLDIDILKDQKKRL